jgi:hypothetical protein
VQIEYREAFTEGENACLGAGTSIGTLEPISRPFPI